ncbi:MAG: hypothetical protein ACRBBR_06510 [Cellvibrionaceae bacterium]
MPKNSAQPKTTPFTLRLTAAQRALLERKAGKLPLGDYIRQTALYCETVAIESENLYPANDSITTHQILAELGRSRISEHLNALAQSAKLGTLVLTEDESAVLIEACADIAMIRRRLMRALGHRGAANDH